MAGKRILISPLNWGLGHAGRMIPLALELKHRGNEVIFAADKELVPLIERALHDIEVIPVPGIRIRYSGFLPQYICILLQVPQIVFSALREHFFLKRLTRNLMPDIIISDNRFGFFHRQIFSVFVTHQLRIPFPAALRILEPAAAWINRMVINRYDLCLIPDYPGKENLSGRLSHSVKLPLNVVYMGPLSRFTQEAPAMTTPGPPWPYFCLLLSGPEPQRSLFFQRVSRALEDMHLVVITPAMLPCEIPQGDFITFRINPGTREMKNLLSGSSLVISRSGYTSVMELASLGTGAVIVPTPGQTEQEYLARHLNGRYGFVSLKQEELQRLKEYSTKVEKQGVPHLPDSTPLLDKAVNILLEKKKHG